MSTSKFSRTVRYALIFVSLHRMKMTNLLNLQINLSAGKGVSLGVGLRRWNCLESFNLMTGESERGITVLHCSHQASAYKKKTIKK